MLLEREAQLAELEGLVAAVADGGGGLTLIEGAPGIGKTRLLSLACEGARERGLRVLFARGGELERDFAFGIVRQLFEPLLRSCSPAERERLVAGTARLSEAVFDVPAAHSAEGGDVSHAVLHGLYWLVANIADQGPVVVAIDDAHWADGPSLRFVGFVSRRLEGMGVLVALASRRDEPGAQAAAVRGICQEAGVLPIQPGPLSQGAVSDMVRMRLGEASSGDLCVACHDVTRGNPFLLGELLMELDEERLTHGFVSPTMVSHVGPQSVASRVLGRLGRLSEAAASLARAVAVLGERVDLRHAATLAGLEREGASGAADLLAGASILERGRPLAFVHPIVRTAIYEGIAPAERSRAHARAARLLSDDGAAVEAVALQLLSTEPAVDQWVLEMLRQAAGAALERGAPEIAVRYLRRALEEARDERAEVLVELGTAEARAADPAARAHLTMALEHASDPWLKVRAMLELGQTMGYLGAAAESTPVALRIREEVRDEPAQARWIETVLLLNAEIDLGARRLSGEVLQQAVQAVDRLGARAPLHLLAIAALERAWAGGTAEEITGLAQRALADGRLTEGLVAETPWPYIAAVALTIAGKGELTERALATAMVAASERGSARGFGVASASRALSRYRSGELDRATADARAFLDLSEDSAWHLLRPLALASLMNVLIERDELTDCAKALARWDVAPRAPESCPAQPLREARARLHMARRKPREALTELQACADWEAAWGAHNGVWVQWRSSAALAHLALGERKQAHMLIHDELQRTRRFAAPSALGVTLSAAGLVEGGGAGIELLGEAVTHLERSEARLEHARALVHLGAAIRREGRRTEAREPLRAGLDLASRLGASALAETAHQELVAAGARPRRTLVTGHDSLTPSERRVSEMAAVGQSNREIAQSLFLTVRTIEMHLSNAYRKLDISSRDELSAALGEEAPSVGVTNGAFA